jgi:hypothetical protein
MIRFSDLHRVFFNIEGFPLFLVTLTMADNSLVRSLFFDITSKDDGNSGALANLLGSTPFNFSLFPKAVTAFALPNIFLPEVGAFGFFLLLSGPPDVCFFRSR